MEFWFESFREKKCYLLFLTSYLLHGSFRESFCDSSVEENLLPQKLP